jgi:glycosyltransferase involved in cell wall biosynthesis
MKILIYTDIFAPSIGGVQTITATLARGLAEWSAPPNGQAAVTNNVTVVTQTPAGTFDDSGFPFRVVRRPSFLELYRLIRRAEIVHVVGPAILPMAIGLLLRKPVVVEHHGYQAVCPSGIYLHQPDAKLCPGHFTSGNYLECFRCQTVEASAWTSSRNLLLLFPRRWLAKQVDANVGPSDYTGDRIALPRTQTIYHGIEDPLATEAQPLVLRRPICFAYLGRLVPEKGVDLLLRAAANVKRDGRDFRLKIIGDGSEGIKLKSVSTELSLQDRVSFLGYRHGRELAQSLSDVSVSVIPSRWEEVAGLSAIEPMMSGRLVVAAEIGGLGEMVGNAGMKFPPGDADALAACMSRAIDDPELVRSLGAAARRRALQIFSKEEMMQQHLALYGQSVHANSAYHD